MIDRWLKQLYERIRTQLRRVPLPPPRVRAAIVVLVVLAVFAFTLFRPPTGDGEGFLGLQSPTTTVPPPPLGPPGPWEFAFGDDFTGESLDKDDWSTCYPWAEDGCTNPGNNELQWYQDRNVSLLKGRLRLTAEERSVTGDDGQDYDYTSGIVTTGAEPGEFGTDPKFEFRYGYVEARVKVPKGQGLWPALWLLPSNQEWPPEIDIMEILGNDTTTAYLTNHYEGPGGRPAQSQGMARGVDFSLDYHTFGVDWQPDSITWYVDGVERRRYNDPSNIPQEDMYVLMNLAVGGDWPGAPARNTAFPAFYDIDWVRVWQRS